jgi:hypothetical protein
MTSATAISVCHALHEWTEPISIRIYPFLPHDIVRSITELALINQRDVWYDKRNRERDMEICALSAATPRRCDVAPDSAKETPGRLSAPIFAWVREEALLWNRDTKSWTPNAILPSYHNEWQFPHYDGGFMLLSDHLKNRLFDIGGWRWRYKNPRYLCQYRCVIKHFHRAFLMAEFNDDIYDGRVLAGDPVGWMTD